MANSRGSEIRSLQGVAKPVSIFTTHFSVLSVLAMILCLPIQHHAKSPVAAQVASPINAEEVSGPVLALLERGDALMKAKRYDEAIAQYKTAVAKAERPSVTAYLNLGSAHYANEDLPAATEAFRKAIEIKPNDYRGHYNLAETLYLSGDYRNSEAEYRRVIALVPQGIVNTQAKYFLGLALHKQGRADEAMVQYRTAITQANGKYAEAHYNLGTALLERKEYAAAESEFRTSIEQDKTFPEAYFNLGVALENQKRIREAIEQYEKYLGLIPKNADAASLRTHVEKLKQQK